MTASAAEDEFLDVVRLWRLAPGTYAAEVIDAAVGCLVAGSDTEALRELAGASAADSRFVLDPLILRTVDQLGLSDALEPDLQLPALLVLIRRLRFGRISPRELAVWAHTHIGHDGGVECQPFVTFDDMYDEAEYVGYEESEIDEMVRKEADALLVGAASPGLSLNWPMLSAPEQSRQASRSRFWPRRRNRSDS